MRLLRPRTSGAERKRALTADQLSMTWQAASLLLDYPDAGFTDRVDLVQRAARTLPAVVAEPLATCATRLGEPGLEEVQAAYVETFDTRRRHNLFLTYFAHGDTRKRGQALLRFKQTYAAAGAELGGSDLVGEELPDHLCVVLEFAATVDRDAGRQLMLDHRAGLELLRLSLEETDSPWAGAVQAVSLTLPPLAGDEMEAVRRLAAEGPPEEEVGLSPYAMPSFDPGPASPDGPVALPMPSFPAPSTEGGR